MFRPIISPVLRSIRLCLQLAVQCIEEVACWWPQPCHQQAASSVRYTASCKQSSALEDERNYRPKHVELIEISDKLLLLHLFGCLYFCISDARSHENQREILCYLRFSKLYWWRVRCMIPCWFVISYKVWPSFKPIRNAGKNYHLPEDRLSWNITFTVT